MAALVINNVQTGTIAFGTNEGSKTATITSVDISKCFILIDVQVDGTAGDRPDRFLFRAVLTNNTTITVDRGDATLAGTAIVRWWAVEFSAGLTVLHFTGTSRNTNVAIGATVDLSKTFGICSALTGFNVWVDHTVNAVDIISTTNFQVKVDDATSGDLTWGVQIVEFDSDADPVVEAVTIVLSGVASNTGTIGAVTIANSMIIGGNIFTGVGANSDRSSAIATLSDTTTVLVERISISAGITAYVFVIDWGANVDLRSGESTLTTAEGTSETQTFSALGGTGDAIAFISGGALSFGAQRVGTGGTEADDFIEAALDSTTQITISRQAGATNDIGPYYWQVIDFSGFVAAGVTTRRYSLPLMGVG